MKKSDQVAGEPTVREARIVLVQVVLQTLQSASIGPVRVLRQGRGGEVGASLERGGQRRIRNFEGSLFYFDIGINNRGTGVGASTIGHEISVSHRSGSIRSAR